MRYPRRFARPLSPAALALTVALAAAAASAEEDAAPVTIAAASLAPAVEELPLTGSATAQRVSALSPKVDGFVEAVHVDAGDTVETGQVLIELDRTIAELELARARAAVEEARARLAEARRQRDEAAALIERKHVSRTELEAREAEVAIQTAALARLAAERERQEEVLSRHSVRAPFAGVIARKRTEVGEWIAAGTPVLDLVEIDVLRIEVPVPQRYFGRVHVGTPVLVRFDAEPEGAVETVVTMKVPVASETARTFPIRIDVPNPDHRRAAGMSARVVLRLAEDRSERVLLVPRDALLSRPDGGRTLWVVAESDGVPIARAVEVRTGRSHGDRIEIIDGALAPGDRVVVRGNERLTPGRRLQILP